MKLELVESLQLVHPFIPGFDQLHYVIGEVELNAVTAGDISEIVTKRTAQDVENVEGGKAIYSTTFYIGLRVEPKPGSQHLAGFPLAASE
jgi:poly(A) polymerase